MIEQKINKINSYLIKHIIFLQFIFAILIFVGNSILLGINYSKEIQEIVLKLIKTIGLSNNYRIQEWFINFFLRLSIRYNLIYTILFLFFDAFFLFVIFRNKIEQSEKMKNVVCITTGIFSALFVALILDNGNGWGGDFSEYIAQSRAIVTRTIKEQVENNTYIINNSGPMLGDAVYPWGFPFLLSPFFAIFGKNLFALKIPVLICFSISVIFCNLIFRKHFSFFQAELMTLFIAINPNFIYFCNSPLSDIPFLSFSMISIYFIEKLFYETKNTLQNSILVGVFSFCAFMTRSIGIIFPCLLFSLHILTAFSKNPKINYKIVNFGFINFPKIDLPTHFLSYFIFVILYILQKSILPQAGNTYIQDLNLVNLKSILVQIKYYSLIFKDFFPCFQSILYSWLILFFAYGFIRYFFKYPVFSIYILGVMGMLILWPGQQGIRFCFPVFPIIMIFTAFGIRDFIKSFSNKKILYMLISFELCILILFSALFIQRSLFHSNEYGAYSKDAKELYSYVKKNIKENEKIIFFKPRVLYLETGRLGFRTSDIGRLSEVDYLLLSKDGYGTFDYDIEEQYPKESKNLDKVFENESLKMYKVNFQK